ncbi:MAG: hypothetical protein IH987_09325 [Planctomycetes bacterium]|nr:hypothetical protein [Planctomycetota bacterium]
MPSLKSRMAALRLTMARAAPIIPRVVAHDPCSCRFAGGFLFILSTFCMFSQMDNILRIQNTANRWTLSAAAVGLTILACGCVSPGNSRPTSNDFPTSEIQFTEAEFDKWRDLISPTADELAFERIAWSPSLGEGLERASVEQKPLLLWMMNGHPLGRT